MKNDHSFRSINSGSLRTTSSRTRNSPPSTNNQVRLWISWHRCTLLAMLTYAFHHHRHGAPDRTSPRADPADHHQVRHLFVEIALPRPALPDTFKPAWSWWRRRRQFLAQECHYHRQAQKAQIT
ncbi:hypothetical protein [Frankia sp. AiPa1]|uniref:hypothetical protein n=1 Tax=Frankia sp. AiPa1 TaxID=573492 RepID=UPI00202B5506|nr:hypothetical protein [Frankia sp. AiPa1]MCL9758120.1 hypothetical protein [Frankia sp. AiPa1]